MTKSMRPKVKTARRSASKLHGATAQYVSLVDRGANETPFNLVKTAKGVSAVSIKQRGKTTTKKSHKGVGSGKKTATTETKMITEMASMTFDSAIFKSKKSVSAKIEDMEWDAEGIVIAKNDDGDWVARPDGMTDDDYERLEKVETDEDGVEANVGERAVTDEDEDKGEDATGLLLSEDEDDDDGDDDEDEDDADDGDDDEAEPETKAKKKPYKKTAVKPAPKALQSTVSKRASFVNERKTGKTKVVKFDSWDARFTKGNTMAKALADGMEWDGLPPGYVEVQAAFSGVTSSIITDDGLGSGKQEALNKAALDFAEIIGGLDTFFDGYVDADEETIAKVFPDKEAREVLAKWAGDYGDVLAGKEPEVLAKSVGSEAFDYDRFGTTVQELVSKAVEGLTQEVKAVSGTVESLASRRPLKKAAAPDALGGSDADDDDEATEVQKTEKWKRQKQNKALF